MTALLGAWGVETTTARDGEEALAAFDAGRFDLAVLDMLMPGMDGLDLATRLHERAPALPDDPRLVGRATRGRRGPAMDRRGDRLGAREADQGLGAARRRRDGARRRRRPTAPDAASDTALDPELACAAPAADPADRGQRREPASRAADAREARYRADVAGQRARGGRGASSGRRTTSCSWTCRCRRWTASRRRGGSVERHGEGDRPWIVAMTAEAMQGDREAVPRRRDERLRREADPPAGARRGDPANAPPRAAPGRPGDRCRAERRPIDDAVLSRLAESMGGDESFVAELIEQFLADSPQPRRRRRASASSAATPTRCAAPRTR